jgi:hypothetical protein
MNSNKTIFNYEEDFPPLSSAAVVGLTACATARPVSGSGLCSGLGSGSNPGLPLKDDDSYASSYNDVDDEDEHLKEYRRTTTPWSLRDFDRAVWVYINAKSVTEYRPDRPLMMYSDREVPSVLQLLRVTPLTTGNNQKRRELLLAYIQAKRPALAAAIVSDTCTGLDEEQWQELAVIAADLVPLTWRYYSDDYDCPEDKRFHIDLPDDADLFRGMQQRILGRDHDSVDIFAVSHVLAGVSKYSSDSKYKAELLNSLSLTTYANVRAGYPDDLFTPVLKYVDSTTLDEFQRHAFSYADWYDQTFVDANIKTAVSDLVAFMRRVVTVVRRGSESKPEPQPEPDLRTMVRALDLLDAYDANLARLLKFHGEDNDEIRTRIEALQRLPVEERMSRATANPADFVESHDLLNDQRQRERSSHNYIKKETYVDVMTQLTDVDLKYLRDLNHVATRYLQGGRPAQKSWKSIATRRYSSDVLARDLQNYIDGRFKDDDETAYDFVIMALGVLSDPCDYKAVAALRHACDKVKALAVDLVPKDFESMTDMEIFRAVQRIVKGPLPDDPISAEDSKMINNSRTRHYDDALYWTAQMVSTFYSIGLEYTKHENRFLVGDTKKTSKLALSVDKSLVSYSQWSRFVHSGLGDLRDVSGPVDEAAKSKMTTAELRRYVHVYAEHRIDQTSAPDDDNEFKEYLKKDRERRKQEALERSQNLKTLLGWLERVCEEDRPLVQRADFESIIDAAAEQALLELLAPN